MHLLKFILFYKVLGFFIAFVLPCSPDNTVDWIPISISTSASPIRRLNIKGYYANPGSDIIDFNYAIESTGSNSNRFKINASGNKYARKFYIECDVCGSKKNSTDWIQYYSLCSIKNIATGLCMTSGNFIVRKVAQDYAS
ncbi:hypothetical protein GLOIN_2v1638721 [Rhizophagus clarus]|uniref:Uncharacterized protein n=1 Tax=Rhizophagus clarus TaxID=94130 RepID=A0A8H3LDS8_9GLOM|nr:hypothetical protein GLOIN_2v1638721 [Rhizophagus clarus]